MNATRVNVDLPVEGELPLLDGATGWLNSQPLTPTDLRGNIVLVDFWTYTCINWLRTLGYVRAWAKRYVDQGLIVVGVHTPEFPFEADNVRWAAREMKVEYPIALDSDYAVWTAFDNRYWPAIYIADAQGRVRYHQFGEGGYAECETTIQRLLRDAGRDDVSEGLVSVADDGFEAQADWANLESPETYLGYERGERLASREEPLRLNDWALSGDWTVERRASVVNKAGGQIAFRFHARDLHLIMAPPAREVSARFHVLIDGQPPGDAHGLDVDDQGNGTVVEPRLYQLIRQAGPISEHTFEITFLDSDVRAYVFTFG